MSDPFYGVRRSGRSTRMLKAAAHALKHGQRVAIVVAHAASIEWMKVALLALLKSQRKGITELPTTDRLRFLTLAHVDMLSLVQCPSYPPVKGWPTSTTVTLVDHFAVQTYMELFVPLLRKWDVK